MPSPSGNHFSTTCFVFINLLDETTWSNQSYRVEAIADVGAVSQVRNYYPCRVCPYLSGCPGKSNRASQGGSPAYRTSFSFWTRTFIFNKMAQASTATGAFSHPSEKKEKPLSPQAATPLCSRPSAILYLTRPR